MLHDKFIHGQRLQAKNHVVRITNSFNLDKQMTKESWMKKIIGLFVLCFSVSSFAATSQAEYCVKADRTTGDFCATFTQGAQCHCREDGHLPGQLCTDMNLIYERMVKTFKTQQRACDWQAANAVPERTTSKDCMDDWNCFRNGGVDSKGQLCSGTGRSCR